MVCFSPSEACRPLCIKKKKKKRKKFPVFSLSSCPCPPDLLSLKFRLTYLPKLFSFSLFLTFPFSITSQCKPSADLSPFLPILLPFVQIKTPQLFSHALMAYESTSQRFLSNLKLSAFISVLHTWIFSY